MKRERLELRIIEPTSRPSHWLMLPMILAMLACSQASARTEPSPDSIRIEPGSERLDLMLYAAEFKYNAEVVTRKDGKESPFRTLEAQVTSPEFGVAVQEMNWSDSKGAAATHRIVYDATNLGVREFSYDTKRRGRDISLFVEEGQLRRVDHQDGNNEKVTSIELAGPLFAPESHEMILAGVQVEKGERIALPLLIIQKPYKTWVEYEYVTDEQVEVGGRTLPARVFQSQTRRVWAIAEAPYISMFVFTDRSGVEWVHRVTSVSDVSQLPARP